MLGSLWDALSIPEDAPERNMVAKMLSVDRPQRLHKRTLDKVWRVAWRMEPRDNLAIYLALSGNERNGENDREHRLPRTHAWYMTSKGLATTNYYQLYFAEV